jgi:hypothetical protein
MCVRMCMCVSECVHVRVCIVFSLLWFCIGMEKRRVLKGIVKIHLHITCCFLSSKGWVDTLVAEIETKIYENDLIYDEDESAEQIPQLRILSVILASPHLSMCMRQLEVSQSTGGGLRKLHKFLFDHVLQTPAATKYVFYRGFDFV